MLTRIVRHHSRVLQAQLTTDPATTATLDFREAAGGAIAVPADSGITAVMYYAAVMPGREPLPLCDAAGNAVVQTIVAGNVYALPDACFGVGLLAAVADADGVVSFSLKG
jgi:hypothetical protein